MRFLVLLSAGVFLFGCKKESEEKKTRQKPRPRRQRLILSAPETPGPAPDREEVEKGKSRGGFLGIFGFGKKKKDKGDDEDSSSTEKKSAWQRLTGRGWFGNNKEGVDENGDSDYTAEGPRRRAQKTPPLEYDKLSQMSLQLLLSVTKEISEYLASKPKGPDLSRPFEIGLEEENGIKLDDSMESLSTIERTSESAVYPLQGGELVIKYRSNPVNVKNLLVRNEIFMRTITRMKGSDNDEASASSLIVQVVPETKKLSGSSEYEAGQSKRGLSSFVQEEDDSGDDDPQEIKNNKSNIMYQVMDRAGLSLHRWHSMLPNDIGVPLAHALMLVKKVVDKLIVLHSMGIVHGDIHWDNVLFASSDEMKADSDLVLIDFDRSYHVLDAKHGNIPSGDEGKAAQEYLAPDELTKPFSPPSMGSDMFRAYELAKFLLSKRSGVNGVDKNKSDATPEKVASMKKSNIVFSTAPEGLNGKGKTEFVTLGKQIHALVLKGLDSKNFNTLAERMDLERDLQLKLAHLSEVVSSSA